jgi:hypothetical protein
VLPLAGSEFANALPGANTPLVTPFNPAALSLILCGRVPVSDEMLSTISNASRLLVRYLVVWLLERPPPNRLRIDFAVVAIGEISQALPATLLLPLDPLFVVLLYAVASSCLGSECGVSAVLLVLVLFGSDSLDALAAPHPPACLFEPRSLRTYS